MILLKKYESLEDVLLHIKIQILESLDFAEKFIPTFNNPRELFYWLHDRVTYLSDPTTIELIMTMQTMMDGTRTGIPGAGDCDDFTITAMACLYVAGFTENQIVLAGRKKNLPVHIYCRTYFNGDWYVFDLTNDQFDYQRSYKYIQHLDFEY
jgi:transglutaminase-like putative cysteine protease